MKSKIFLGWRQVAVSLLIQAVSTATIASAFSVLAVPIGHAFETSRMMLMLAMTLVALGTGVLSPVLGVVMDRQSLRNLMLIGSVALLAGFFAISLATSITQVLVIYAVLMAPANVLIGPLSASVLVSRWFVKKRGFALGISATGIAIGGVVFPPIIQAIISAFEWRDAFRIIGVMSFLLTAPAILLAVVNHPADRNFFPDGGDSAPEEIRSSDSAKFGATGAIVRDATFWLIALVTGIVLFGNKGVVTNLAPLAMDLGTKPQLAALLISIFSAASFAGKLLFAAAADRLEARMVMRACLLGSILGMASFWQAANGYWLLVAGSLFLGAASGGMIPLMGFLTARAFGAQNVGRVLGAMNFATMPLSLLTPPFFGLIFDKTGSYNYAFLLFISFGLAAFFAVSHIRTQLKESTKAGDAVAGQSAAKAGGGV